MTKPSKDMGHSPNSDAERIIKWLGRNPAGGTTMEISLATDLHPKRVVSLIRKGLEPKGEVFEAGGRWFSTSAVLPLVKGLEAKLRCELEEAVFGKVQPEWFREFLVQFAAGARISPQLSLDENLFLARKKVVEAFPRAVAEAG